MQYPPQPPAEVVLPEQELTDTSGSPGVRVPQIVVYANHIRSARGLAAMTNNMLLTALILLPIAYVLLSAVNHNLALNPATPYLLTLLGFFTILIIFRLAVLRWVAQRSLLVNPNPLLLIQSEGMTFRSHSMLRDIFLTWHEIETIDIYRYKYHYLCLRPRDPRFIAKRFTPLERVLIFVNALFGTPPHSLPLAYLNKPAKPLRETL